MNRPIRIAIASSGLGRIFRGVEAWAADLAAALHARGEEVILYKGGGRREFDYERVIPCLEQGSDRIRRFRGWLPRGSWRLGLGTEVQVEQTTFALNLLRRLRRDCIDVLHVQDAGVAKLVQRAWKLGLVRTKTILGHGTEESLEFQSRIRYLQHLAPWHLEQSRAAGVFSPLWSAIPNFIDVDKYRPARIDGLRDELGIPKEHRVILTAAAIKRHHKRIDYLIAEFAQLLASRPQLPATLIVAGGREAETDELVRLGHEKLGDRVRFLVRFPRSRMLELYQSADLFVLCSLFEMMPIALLEATACGLPCIVNRHPVVKWMTGPGGRSADLSQSGALAGGIAALLDDPASLKSMGAAAREHCVDNFGTDQVVSQLLDYYEFVHGDRSATTRKHRSRLEGAAR